MLRVKFLLPPSDQSREELVELIEGMYPAPRDADGRHMYSPSTFDLFTRKTIVASCNFYGSTSAGDQRKLDEKRSYAGMIEELFHFHIFRDAPIVRLAEGSMLVITLGKDGKPPSHKVEPFLSLEISTACPEFMDRNSYEHCMVSSEGFTFHELADLQFCQESSLFVAEMLRRLEHKLNDNMLQEVSLVFDISSGANLLMDYVVGEDPIGERPVTEKKRKIPILKVAELAEAFGSDAYRSTIAHLFSEVPQRNKPKTEMVIQHTQAFLSGDKELPIPVFLPEA